MDKEKIKEKKQKKHKLGKEGKDKKHKEGKDKKHKEGKEKKHKEGKDKKSKDKKSKQKWLLIYLFKLIISNFIWYKEFYFIKSLANYFYRNKIVYVTYYFCFNTF